MLLNVQSLFFRLARPIAGSFDFRSSVIADLAKRQVAAILRLRISSSVLTEPIFWTDAADGLAQLMSTCLFVYPVD
jgi:hypothetical protein